LKKLSSEDENKDDDEDEDEEARGGPDGAKNANDTGEPIMFNGNAPIDNMACSNRSDPPLPLSDVGHPRCGLATRNLTIHCVAS